ncbi:MAG: hypothetical protein R2752_21300 [Vicinamibacterales bacterium]
MTGPARALTAGVAVIAALALWLLVKPGGDRLVADLIDRFPTAEVKRPSPEAFSIADVTLAGETERAIRVDAGATRLGWQVEVPDDAWLLVGIGQQEPAWTTEGDGVLFMVGVSDGEEYTELASLLVNPYDNPGDRMWHPLRLDLSVWAGKTVTIIFNTRPSPPDPPADDRRGDQPVWGEPRLVVS